MVKACIFMTFKKVISSYSVIPNEATHTINYVVLKKHSLKRKVIFFSCPQHGGLLDEQNYSATHTSPQF